MPSGEPSFDTLTVPDGTHVQERHVLTDGDVFVGGGSTIELGVRGRNVAAGERVDFGGDIEAEGDCRLGLLCDVAGDVYASENAYIGDRAHIRGRLAVAGDLDIGDDVEVEGSLEADGWIVTRTSIPTLVLYFIVLSYYLQVGPDADEGLLDVPEPADTDPLIVPRDAMVTDDFWRVPAPAEIGSECRLHGNIRAETVTIQQETEVFGGLTADGDIVVGPGTVVHGDILSHGGIAEIRAGAHVRGGIDCRELVVHESATVEGTLRADREMRLVQDRSTSSSQSSETDALAAVSGDGTVAETAAEDADPAKVRSRLREILRSRLDEKPYNDLQSIAADIDGITAKGGREELTGKIIDAKLRKAIGENRDSAQEAWAARDEEPSETTDQEVGFEAHAQPQSTSARDDSQSSDTHHDGSDPTEDAEIIEDTPGEDPVEETDTDDGSESEHDDQVPAD